MPFPMAKARERSQLSVCGWMVVFRCLRYQRRHDGFQPVVGWGRHLGGEIARTNPNFSHGWMLWCTAVKPARGSQLQAMVGCCNSEVRHGGVLAAGPIGRLSRRFGAGLLSPPRRDRRTPRPNRPAGLVKQRPTIGAAHPRSCGPIRGRSKSWRFAGLRPIRASCGRAGSGREAGREGVRSGVSRWSLSLRFVKLISCLIMRIQTALSARSILFDRVPGGLLSCAGRMP